jgi:hypothetical protein
MEREINLLSDDELNTVAGGTGKTAISKPAFEVNDYSFDIEQVLNIGSQGSGAGAGKVTFNPF